MNREYKLARYALAAAIVLFTASGVVVVSGLTPTDAGLAANETPQTAVPTDNSTTTLDATNATRIDVSAGDSSNGTVAFSNRAPACSHASRVGQSNIIRTDVEVDGTTITLVSDDETPFERIERQRFVDIVWNDVSDRAGLNESDHIDVRVNQYYETTAREQPLNAVGITVRPSDGCLPTVTGEVTLANETVNVHRTLPALDDLRLAVTDEIGVLDEDSSARLEQLLVADEQASYTIQNQFDDPTTLNATVTEASNDGEIDLKLTAPETDGRTVLVTVDLEAETVVRATMVIDVEISNVDVNESNGTATTISVETNETAMDS